MRLCFSFKRFVLQVCFCLNIRCCVKRILSSERLSLSWCRTFWAPESITVPCSSRPYFVTYRFFEGVLLPWEHHVFLLSAFMERLTDFLASALSRNFVDSGKESVHVLWLVQFPDCAPELRKGGIRERAEVEGSHQVFEGSL